MTAFFVSSSEPIVCTPKTLPEYQKIQAAAIAVQENPTNAPRIDRVIQLLQKLVGIAYSKDVEDEVTNPLHIAALTTKHWGSKGVDLSVSFMETINEADKSFILTFLNVWSEYGNIKFRSTNGVGQVRISRGPGGYWSYVGTDILSIPSNSQTMNLEGITARMSQAEAMRVITHEAGHCLVGDTLIDCPRDLIKYPKGIPIKELVGKTPWVYAWKDGQIVVRKASRVWLSKKKAKVVRVRLKTGENSVSKKYLPPLELVGTPDHRVLLADGITWKKMGNLKPGDRLCSLYRGSYDEGRSTIRWTGLEGRVSEQQFVCWEVHGERPEEHVVHHKNENKLDQRPQNLEWIHHRKHTSLHHKGKTISQEHKEAVSKKLKGKTPSSEALANMKAAQEARAGWKHTEETRKKMSESAKNKPPMSEETKAKLSKIGKGRKQSQEAIANRNAAMRKFYDNGGRSGMYGKKQSPETIAKRVEARRLTLLRKKQEREEVNNHVVISVEKVDKTYDVYDMTVPDADSFVANGVVVHNSAGFPHEHMRRELVAKLDVAKTIQFFQRTQGWSPAMVRQQVLTPIEESSLLMPTPADQDSIMCYQLPGSITIDGQPIRGGSTLSPLDKQYVAKIYPKELGPTPPDPIRPNPPGSKWRLILEGTGPRPTITEG